MRTEEPGSPPDIRAYAAEAVVALAACLLSNRRIGRDLQIAVGILLPGFRLLDRPRPLPSRAVWRKEPGKTCRLPRAKVLRKRRCADD
jgi:hypothetical protein